MEIKMSYAAMEKIVVFKLKEHGFDITDINYNHPDYTRTDIHEALENVKITFSVELPVWLYSECNKYPKTEVSE